MTELFLLGAGASVEAEVPDAYKMTNEMLRKIADNGYSHYQRIDKVLQFVVGGLLFQQGIRGENPYNGVNIEDLFNAVILLGDRQNSELGPFISSWHPQLVGLESGRMSNFMSRDLLKTVYKPIEDYMNSVVDELLDKLAGSSWRGGSISFRRREIDPFHASSDFERDLTKAVHQVMTGGEGELFKAAADAMILKLVEMVWITNPEKVTYLIPLIQYAKDTNSTVVTLNYDNAIEMAAQITGIETDTGFDSWSESGDFVYGDGKIPLLKLHGSIDWALSDGHTSKEKPLPFQVITKVDPNVDERRSFHPAVVFGGKNKLTAKGPFLSLVRSFEQQLSKTEKVTIIGYSFRDEHVNEFILNWFNGNATRLLKIINPNPASLNREFTRYLFNGYAKERVQVVEKITSIGISNLAEAD